MADPFASGYPTPGESPGFLLWQVAAAWQARQRAALAPLGLTHVQFVLLAGVAWLERAGSPVTQVGLARHAGTDPMMTSQVVRTLERKGLLERAPHPRDSRANSLAATVAGRELAAAAIPVVEAVDAAFFAAVGDDLPALTGMLRGLAASAGRGPDEGIGDRA